MRTSNHFCQRYRWTHLTLHIGRLDLGCPAVLRLPCSPCHCSTCHGGFGQNSGTVATDQRLDSATQCRKRARRISRSFESESAADQCWEHLRRLRLSISTNQRRHCARLRSVEQACQCQKPGWPDQHNHMQSFPGSGGVREYWAHSTR